MHESPLKNGKRFSVHALSFGMVIPRHQLHKSSRYQPMSPANLVVFRGSRVLLPDLEEPVEASIVVDTDKGTILSVVEGPLNRVVDNVEVIDAGDNVILPGLVE